MKLKFTIIAFIAVTFTNLYSQKSFAKGYYIDTKNSRVECLIKDEDWDISPAEFTTKKDDSLSLKVISANDFIEFGVNEFKFIKAKVKIDKSSDIFINLAGDKTLNLEDETIVLRVLMEGDASLYRYKNQSFMRFFYSQNNSEIIQLSFKMYKGDGGIGKNNSYKQELLNSLKCDEIKPNDIDNLEYQTDKLSDFFKKYNVCKSSNLTEFKAPKVINTLEFYIKAGVGISNLNFNNSISNFDFGSKINIRPAVETEINLSNKRKKFSILIEFSYQYFKESAITSNGNSLKVDYKPFDLSTGFRNYIHLNPKALLFASGYITYGIPVSSTFGMLNLRSSISPSIAIGFLYNRRYTLDVRYDFNRDLLNKYRFLSATYNTLSLNIGYKLL